MQSSKHASLVRFIDPVTFLSIVLGMVLFINFVYWIGKTQGVEAGYLAKEAESLSTLTMEAGAPYVSREDRTYAKLALNYRYLSYFLSIVVVLSLASYRISMTEMKVLFAVINVLLLILAIRYLLWLVGLKNPELNESLGSPYNAIVVETVAYDRTSIAMILALLSGQVGLIVLYFLCTREKKKTDVAL